MKQILPPDWKVPTTDDPAAWTIGQVVPAYDALSSCPNGCYDGHLMGWHIVEHGGTKHYFDPAKMFWRRAELWGVPCPVCQGGARKQWLVNNSGLAGLSLEGKPMISLGLPSPARGQEEAVEIARRLLMELPEPHTWALFHGTYGSGKTHLLAGMVVTCMAANTWARYATSAQVLASIRASYDSDKKAATEGALAEWTRVPVLALDELDRVKWSEWAGEQLFEILNTRHLARRATWMASNKAPQELELIAEPLAAIVSRISSGEIVHVSTPDLRPGLQTRLEENDDD